ncbi:MAG: thiamine phosphate synthase [Lachnospiraceae bacterium]|nr:thiamine phosphate synthase [Lachnospiraceae bacterium]
MSDYSRMIAVTDRHVFDNAGDPGAAFLRQLKKIAMLGPKAVVLREKDLDPAGYLALSQEVLACLPDPKLLILHSFWETALELGVPKIHLPLHLLKELYETKPDLLREFEVIGTSVHSVGDAADAVRFGASYLFAGNVYETTCKPGLEGRGLAYLRDVARSVSVPVYGIGGITAEKMPDLLAAGAAGGCMMSGFMAL